MDSSTIDYAPIPGQQRRAPWIWRGAVAFVTILLGLSLYGLVGGIVVSTVTLEMDTVSGSHRVTTERLWASKPIVQTTTTAFATALADRKINYTPKWVFMSGAKQNCFGRTLSIGCAGAPDSNGYHWLLAAHCDTMSDEALRKLVTVLETGSDEQQRAALDDIVALLRSGGN